MGNWRLDRVLEVLTSMELVVGLLWGGLAVLTVTMLVLMRTRWGQQQPLRKCVVLSLLAHMLLAGYATTVQIVAGYTPEEEPGIRVSFVEGGEGQAVDSEQPATQEKPWEEFQDETLPQPEPVDPTRTEIEETPEPERTVQTKPGALPGRLPLDHLELAAAPQPEGVPRTSATPVVERSQPGPAAAIDAPVAERRDPPRVQFPNGAAPRPRVAPSQSRANLQREALSGVPSELIAQLAPAPSMATEAITADRAEALSGSFDRLARAGREEPVRSSIRETMKSPQAFQTAGLRSAGVGGPPAGANAARTPTGADSGKPTPDSTASVEGERTDATTEDRGHPDGNDQRLPSVYRLRVAEDRARQAEKLGATPATEAAVKAALRWLADNQESDGRWDAGQHGGGREQRNIAGRNRLQAGLQADTGMTGLALLAFLASGETHLRGDYRETVRRGLEYLLRAQKSNGELGGAATAYARMYCHSMALFALSEAYGMTEDHRLRTFVQRGVNYSVDAQDPSGGGYRYNPRDPGDTSQAGWQLMALKSADLAGVSFPTKTRDGLIRYLRSVSAGQHGGLASYRPGERVSRPMTAEAMVCWQFLGLSRDHPACDEAGDYLLGELPGVGEANLYYWYYGTLTMYQLGGQHWSRWNESLQKTLLARQRKQGDQAGSWDADTVWGGYGGRVYSTALSTLCLEVYYRFLPLYVQARPEEDP